MSTTYQQRLDEKIKENGEVVRWLITVAVSIGALLEVIDTSITNVALPYIRGNIGATLAEAGWVITGYSMANGIMIPLSAWLGDFFGRKSYFLFSLFGFTLASVLCGISPDLTCIVIARILQGLFGGGLLAKAQSLLFETFPREKQGLAQSVFGICVIVGPIIGPTLGGYLTDILDWRWIFFINVPVGILAIAMCWMFLPEDGERKISPVDWTGIAALTIGLGSLQYVLEKGQDDDWFSSRTILTLAIVAVVSLVVFIAHELTIEHPAVDLKVLKLRSVGGGAIYSFILGFGLYGISFVVPTFAQSVLNYTATNTGLLLVPGSIATAFMMPVIGQLGRKIDARIWVASGAIGTAASMMMLAQVTSNTGWDQFYWPLVIRGITIAMMFMPLTLASIGDCRPDQIAGATGFMNLSRQLGGSVGIAVLTTVLARRNDFHRAVLVEKVTPYSAAALDRLNNFAGMFRHLGTSPHDALGGARALMDTVVASQAMMLSFEDLFWIIAMTFLFSLPVVLLLAKGTESKNKAAAAAAH
jgi:MFS transporter, DHA2 family, multidrug resistance protein